MVAASEIRRAAIREVVLVNANSIKSSSTPSNIEYIDISSVGTGEFTEPPKLMSFADAPSRARRIVKAGDTILSTVRPNRRSFLFLSSPSSIAVASTGFAVLTPTPAVDARYLYYWVTRQDFTDYLSLHAKGAAYPAVSAEDIGGAEIDLPPLPVQQRIAGILSAYDELIENSQRRIKILEAMTRGLYREWFVHFRFPGHENHPRAVSALGETPKGWKVAKLDELIKSHIGGGWGKDESVDGHSEPAWVIRGTDIPDARHSQFTGVPNRFHTVSNLRSRRLQVGDIVFEVSGGSKGQPVGRSLLITSELLSGLDGDVICASFCKRIEPDPNSIGSELLYLSFVEGYESGEIEQYQVQSTGISNFKWTEYIANTERVIPPKGIQDQFRQHVSVLFTEIATLGLKIQNLRSTRDLLLPRLLSGQIKVEAQ